MSTPSETANTPFAHATSSADSAFAHATSSGDSALAPRKLHEPHTPAESSESAISPASGGSRPNPAISVIVPIYNVRDYVADCIRSLTIAVTSLRSQYGLGAEIIVVDDGSTDGSGDIVESLAHGDSACNTTSRGSDSENVRTIRAVHDLTSDTMCTPAHDPTYNPAHDPAHNPAHNPTYGPTCNPAHNLAHDPTCNPAHNPTIRIFHTDNNGLASARNFGVDQARGEYVSFVDGDDMVSPDYLCTLHAGMIIAGASAEIADATSADVTDDPLDDPTAEPRGNTSDDIPVAASTSTTAAPPADETADPSTDTTTGTSDTPSAETADATSADATDDPLDDPTADPPENRYDIPVATSASTTADLSTRTTTAPSKNTIEETSDATSATPSANPNPLANPLTRRTADRLHSKTLVIGTYVTVPEDADLQQAIALTNSPTHSATPIHSGTSPDSNTPAHPNSPAHPDTPAHSNTSPDPNLPNLPTRIRHTSPTAPGPTSPSRESAVHVMTSANAIRRTLAGVVPIQAVAKLARRDWYVQHPYAARHLYEDLETIIPLLSSADTIALISAPIYCYRQRPGSITRNTRPSMKQLQDYCHAIDTFERECAARCDTAAERDLLAYQIATQCTRLHRTMRSASRAKGGLSAQERDLLRAMDAQTDARVRSLLPAALRASDTSRAGRIRIRLFCLSRLLYDMAFDCYEALAKR